MQNIMSTYLAIPVGATGLVGSLRQARLKFYRHSESPLSQSMGEGHTDMTRKVTMGRNFEGWAAALEVSRDYQDLSRCSI